MNQSDKKYLKNLLTRDPRLAVEKLKDHLAPMPQMLEKVNEIESQQESLLEEEVSQGERENRQGELNESILQIIDRVAIDEADGTQIIGHPKYKWILFELIALGVLALGGILALIFGQFYVPALILLVLVLVLVFVLGKPIKGYLKNQQTIIERGKKYYQNLERFPERTKVLIEGDSWFNDHHTQDVADYLGEHFNVYSFAETGSKMRGILQDNDFRKLVNIEQPQVVLLSAGGTELFEKYLKEIVKTTADESDFFTSYYTGFKRDITQLYKEALEDLGMKCQKIIVSGYDYMVHKQGTVHQLLVKRGFAKPEAVKTKLIDDLNESISEVVAQYTNAHYLDLRGTLTDQNEWADELHPNAKGFAKVAAKFKSKIDE